MDDHGHKMQDLESALGLASALEKYGQAAELKKELDELNADDVVEQILEVTNIYCHTNNCNATMHAMVVYSRYRHSTGAKCCMFIFEAFNMQHSWPTQVHVWHMPQSSLEQRHA